MAGDPTRTSAAAMMKPMTYFLCIPTSDSSLYILDARGLKKDDIVKNKNSLSLSLLPTRGTLPQGRRKIFNKDLFLRGFPIESGEEPRNNP
jgi:hypothetical protein